MLAWKYWDYLKIDEVFLFHYTYHKLLFLTKEKKKWKTA